MHIIDQQFYYRFNKFDEVVQCKKDDEGAIEVRRERYYQTTYLSVNNRTIVIRENIR